jgi:hypothetical protein
MRTKYLFALLLLLFQQADLTAQSTQQGALLQQIAALKVYGQYVQKGYSIVKKGLDVIGDFKDGEKMLHSDYFQSLGIVNTVLYDGLTVSRIIGLQEKIIREGGLLEEDLMGSLLREDEISYCKRVKSRLMENCWQEMEFLYDLLTDDTLQMEDAQRLQSIERIYLEMKGNYTFIKEFLGETRIMINDRQREHRETLKSRELFNIN